MTDVERQDLLFLLSKLRAHAVSAAAIGEPVEAASFEAKVQALMQEHQVTEVELEAFIAAHKSEEAAGQQVEPVAPPKLNCYRVLYAVITVADEQRSTQDKNHFVLAATDQEAGAAIATRHPGLEVQVQQVATVAKDVVVA